MSFVSFIDSMKKSKLKKRIKCSWNTTVLTKAARTLKQEHNHCREHISPSYMNKYKRTKS